VEEELPTTPDGTERPISSDGVPPLPAEVSTREEELRRLVDAGAASPEELRALAAKLEEKRTYENSLWEREVRPALMQSKKRRLSVTDLRSKREGEPDRHALVLACLLVVAVLVLLLIATATSVLWLLVAVGAVLVYAWVQGRNPTD
jgi:Flp pilus assembly protein TadB